MTLLKNINNHILAFYDKIVSFFTNAKKKKYFMPLVFVGVFLIVFIFFFIFTYSHPIYEGQIYQFGHDWYINRDLENAYRNEFLNKLDTTYILITGPKKNPLCLYADVVIHLPSEEEYRDKIASFSSDVAMQYAVNILYSYLFALNYEENLKSRYSSVSKDGKIELN